MDNVFKAMGVKLIQRVNEFIVEWTPRQAIVVRAEGSHVFVRFVRESAGSPESSFVSTVAGVPAGTVGWVFTLGGKKGLFVATGIPSYRPLSNATNTSLVASTAGVYDFEAAEVTFSGLVPGRAYVVTASPSVKAGSSASGTFRLTFTVNGSVPISPTFVTNTILNILVSWTYSVTAVADSSGEITVRPAVVWNTGTTSIAWASITASIS